MAESRNKTMLHEEISARAKNKAIKITIFFNTDVYGISCVLAGVRQIRLNLEEKLYNYSAAHNNM